MKYKKVLPSIALATALMTACTVDFGEPVTQHYSIDGQYTELKVSHAFDVTVSDDVTDAVVTAGEKLHSKIRVEVKNGTLYIGLKKNLVLGSTECTVVLPRNSQLEDLDLSGASSFKGDIQGRDCEVDLSGASSFKGNVTGDEVSFDISGASSYIGSIMTDQMDVDLSGASTMTANGECTGTMDIEISGSSDIVGERLNTSVLTGEISGSSDVDVNVCDRIQVSISGSSTLIYGLSSPECHPQVDCHTSGSSTVRPR